MLKDIKKIELLNSNMFIREPVDDLSKKIIVDHSKKIILSGGRGSGKSIVLYNTEKRNLSNENQVIYMHFDAVALFPEQYNNVFDEQFMDHYYELMFCVKILNYIETNYPLTYETNFKDFKELLHQLTVKTYDYINNSIFEEVSLDQYLKPAEISGIILLKLRRCSNLSSLSLAIDRFDWTNERNALVQNTLSKFFDLFDKVIITTDDETLRSENNRTSLLNKGFSFVNVEYGNDILVVKEIIKKRINYYNENIKSAEISFPENIIDDDIIQYLVHKANGNMSFILSCIGDIIDEWQWTKGSHIKEIDKYAEDRLRKIKELKIMSKEPRLYL